MLHGRSVLLSAVALVLFAQLPAYAVMRPAKKAPAQKVAPVEVVGTLELSEKQGGIVKHRMNGRVQAVLVKAGDQVKLGQAMLTYESGDVVRRLQRARSRFDQAITDGASSENIGALRADLARLEKEADNLTMYAPMSGVITHVTAKPKGRVGRGTEAMRLLVPSLNARRATVTTRLDAKDARRLADGTVVDVYFGKRRVPAAVIDVKRRGAESTITLRLEKAPKSKGPQRVRVVVPVEKRAAAAPQG